MNNTQRKPNNTKMILIPEWRYYKMLESYDMAMRELEESKKQIEILSKENCV